MFVTGVQTCALPISFCKKNLQDTENFFQFQGDADDLKAWLQDAHRLLSGEDVGQDEGATRALGKKHKDFLEDSGPSSSCVWHPRVFADDA